MVGDASESPPGGSQSRESRKLFVAAYEQLRSLAGEYLRRERAGHTLQATALVHEAYIKLAKQGDQDWKDEQHFFRVAAKAMRHVLIDHARTKRAAKRGGRWERVTLGEADAETVTVANEDIIAIDEALVRLAEDEPRQVEIIELRFFCGLTVIETARVVGMPHSTVDDQWHYARAWLHRELARGA